jgi:hypothetical protein
LSHHSEPYVRRDRFENVLPRLLTIKQTASYWAVSPDSFRKRITPRGLNVRQAAAYWGVSVGTFNKLVRLGLAPQLLRLPGCCRNIFDKEALDRAMDAAKGRVMSSVTLQINVIPKWMLDKKEAA